MDKKTSKKVMLIICIANYLILLTLVFIDVFLYISQGLDSIVFRIIELVFASSSAVSTALSISLKINSKKTVFESGSNNSFMTTVHVDGSTTGDLVIAPNGINVSKDLGLIKSDIEMLKKENIDSICEKVYQRIKNEKDLQNVDKDFIIKYLNDGSTISDSDIQNIWAELLVSKVVNGTSVTKRLLDIVKNLSSNEAIIFEKVSKLAVHDGTVYDFFEDAVSFEEISLLIEIGLVKPHDMLSQEFGIGHSDRIILAHNEKMVIVGENIGISKANLSFSCKALTNEGLLLKKILNNNMSDENLIQLAKHIKTESSKKNVNITLHNILKKDGNTINFDKTDLLINLK